MHLAMENPPSTDGPCLTAQTMSPSACPQVFCWVTQWVPALRYTLLCNILRKFVDSFSLVEHQDCEANRNVQIDVELMKHWHTTLKKSA
jgi:hypothetical protein